jgi:hypothetical protein
MCSVHIPLHSQNTKGTEIGRISGVQVEKPHLSATRQIERSLNNWRIDSGPRIFFCRETEEQFRKPRRDALSIRLLRGYINMNHSQGRQLLRLGA